MDKPVHIGRIVLIYLVCWSAVGRAEEARFTPPVRQGVDVYNATGSSSRLIAFMKIGASPKDLRYLGALGGRLSRQPLPKAFLAGSLIYFRGVDQPLKVIDLKHKLFSFNGKKIDLGRPGSIEERMAALERIVFPRSAFIFWDWFMPRAYAATADPVSLAALSGILAVGGLTSSAHCLSQAATEGQNCSQQFMGTLAAIGAVGGMSAQSTATQAFCSPDFKGGQKFVIAGESRNLLSLSRSHGEYEISPPNLQSGTSSAANAAAELLASCKSEAKLSGVNIALAYPAAQAPVHVASSATAVTSRRAPASVPQAAPSETARAVVREISPTVYENREYSGRGAAR